MEHRIKIKDAEDPDWTYLATGDIVERVARLMAEKISPIKLLTYMGYIRYEGEGWRIVKYVGGDWYLEVDDPKNLVYISLLL